MASIIIPATDGSGTFEALVVTPKTQPGGGVAPEARGAVVMIQEIFGVNAAMCTLCECVAEMGFIAVCPDLFWRQEPGVRLDPDAGQAQWDKAFQLFNGFDQATGLEDLAATIATARKLPGCNGKVGTMGFCLGGRMAVRTAVATDAQCHVSYYGVGIEAMLAGAPKIQAPC